MNKFGRSVIVLCLACIIGVSQTYAQETFDDLYPDDEHIVASAELINSEGEVIGGVAFLELPVDDDPSMAGKLGVWTLVWEGLESGFHGFHLHSVGLCESDEALRTAGGHFNPDATTHGFHAGDLPSLYSLQDGSVMLFFVTDAFTLEDLMDEDGSAFIIHSGRDNFANIPDHYGETDEATLGTGDARSRIACGIVTMGVSTIFDN